jgi:hypothetical protein
MRAAELENENGLAGPGETRIKEPRSGLHPLAAFDPTTIGRF